MATIPQDEKLFLVSKTTNTTYSGSKALKEMNEWYTMKDVIDTIKPYKVYTALLYQQGGDDPAVASSTSGALEIGVTYKISVNDENTADFTNIGAPNNNVGTSFVATAASPNSWGINDNAELEFNYETPLANILENTIGNIWFKFDTNVFYPIKSEKIFNKKTWAIITPGDQLNGKSQQVFIGDDSTIKMSTSINEEPANDVLSRSAIEIRIYN